MDHYTEEMSFICTQGRFVGLCSDAFENIDYSADAFGVYYIGVSLLTFSKAYLLYWQKEYLKWPHNIQGKRQFHTSKWKVWLEFQCSEKFRKTKWRHIQLKFEPLNCLFLIQRLNLSDRNSFRLSTSWPVKVNNKIHKNALNLLLCFHLFEDRITTFQQHSSYPFTPIGIWPSNNDSK